MTLNIHQLLPGNLTTHGQTFSFFQNQKTKQKTKTKKENKKKRTTRSLRGCLQSCEILLSLFSDSYSNFRFFQIQRKLRLFFFFFSEEIFFFKKKKRREVAGPQQNPSQEMGLGQRRTSGCHFFLCHKKYLKNSFEFSVIRIE